ncbi:hypothetical protein HETIRDRAFT_432935 [Heterobasidion irregulare TC 32-1]|uniref:Uncharacterized protein n=1 Tax=Heterobasidion irregulare (strain TC 32-1) TaxID=747525 RepID=W4KDT8_HETIT|nr:uncharacterized protein HETIRDRAFT_432935 [Heterobasidion irregulare TC 32-1]ETW83909.1 hypothetical protein HETIRDRAFT_432935 [Heterobasidion irregulare TC 32-1]
MFGHHVKRQSRDKHRAIAPTPFRHHHHHTPSATLRKRCWHVVSLWVHEGFSVSRLPKQFACPMACHIRVTSLPPLFWEA